MQNNKNQPINQAAADAISPLLSVIQQIDQAQYQMPLEILQGNTIGKHVRHIIEFYLCLIDGYDLNFVNYDNRKRNPILETQPKEALRYLYSIQNRLVDFENKDLQLAIQLGKDEISIEIINTNWNRELIYNIEHTTHHLAIIQIAIKENFRQINLPENFGVAMSTIKFQHHTKHEELDLDMIMKR